MAVGKYNLGSSATLMILNAIWCGVGLSTTAMGLQRDKFRVKKAAKAQLEVEKRRR